MSDIHQLLKESIDKIAGQWVAELTTLRNNASLLEQQVLTCVAKAKADITHLHDLGVQVAEEARRGQELCAKLSASVEQITGNAIDEPSLIERAAE
jgi:transcriptional regulator